MYKELQGLNYRNPNAENALIRQWRDSSIYYILRQEVYTGAMVQGKSKNLSYKNKKRIKLPKSEWIVVPNMHEAIINEDLWDEVQKLIKSRKGNDKQFKSKSSEINPLRGIVFCKECGCGMWRMSYQCADRRYKYYRCRTVKNSEGMCDYINSIRQSDLEAVILTELQKLSDTYLDETQISLLKKQDNHIFAVEEEYKQLEKKIIKVQNNSVQLYKDKLNGLINDEQYKLLSNAFNSEISKYQERLKVLSEEKGRILEEELSLSEESVFLKYKNIDKLSFELVREFIEAIYVGKINPKTNEREIEIHWKL